MVKQYYTEIDIVILCKKSNKDVVSYWCLISNGRLVSFLVLGFPSEISLPVNKSLLSI